MKPDPRLSATLARFERISFEGTVFRATGMRSDPKAPSLSGGRWAPRPNDEPGFPVLYTSLERDGALAEVSSYLALLTPLPSRPLAVHELSVSTSRTIVLVKADLKALGVDPDRYGERDYARTQLIGMAINDMGCDGLMSPSARWACANLTLFMDHHAVDEKLDLVGTEEIDWRAWAKDAGIIRN